MTTPVVEVALPSRGDIDGNDRPFNELARLKKPVADDNRSTHNER